jgi:beta-lactamase superfamily II metal-dependent hydrolase
VIKVKRKRLGVAMISIIMSSILVSGSLLTYNAENETRLSYELNQYGDAVLITENGEITVFEAKTYTSSRINETLSCLKEEKITRLDNYILTSYNSKMISALYSLMSEVKINNIYVPSPSTLEEKQIYYQLLSLNEVFNTEIILYGLNPISFSGFNFTLLYRDGETASYEIVHNNKKYLISLSGILESRGANLTLERIYRSDFVIFMRHGKTYKNYNFVYEFNKPKVIIVSSKEMYVPRVTVSNYEKSGAKIIFTPEIYDFIR